MSTNMDLLRALQCKLEEDIHIQDIGYDTVELYRDEVDEYLMPADEIRNLPEKVLVTSAVFVSKEGDEYLLIDVNNEAMTKRLNRIWLINGEVVEE